MGWKNPTSSGNPQGGWNNPDNAINGSTGDYADCSKQDQGDYLEGNIASISCTKVQVYVDAYKVGSHDLDCEIDVYYSGSWHNIHSGTIPYLTWTEKSIGSTQDVTAMRLASNDGTNEARVYAMQFWELSLQKSQAILL